MPDTPPDAPKSLPPLKPSAPQRATLSCLLAHAESGDATAIYGGQLAKELGINPGTLYPILTRLVLRGWLTASWGDEMTGPRRRFYRFTPAGRAAAVEFVNRLR